MSELLTQEALKQLLSYNRETGVFTWIGSKNTRVKNGSVAGSTDSSGHIQIKVNKKGYAAHRLAWLYECGSFPLMQIDHINGNRTDNRIDNLRDVSASVNSQNKRIATSQNKTSGLLGVHWSKAANKWVAAIKLQNKTKYLGVFVSKEDAHQVYINAKRKFHAGCTI